MDLSTHSSERRVAIGSRDAIVATSKASLDSVDLSDTGVGR